MLEYFKNFSIFMFFWWLTFYTTGYDAYLHMLDANCFSYFFGKFDYKEREMDVIV